eukprot:1506690-Amphidinium_carterae.1
MMRRVETQFQRDWTFGPVLWNYLFRSMVNLQSNAYIYEIPDGIGGRRRMTSCHEQGNWWRCEGVVQGHAE